MDDLLAPNDITTGPPELIVADRFRAFREHMTGPNYPADSPPTKDRDRQRAERLIGALDAAGYVIVPKKPTGAQRQLFGEMVEAGDDFTEIYPAVLNEYVP